MENLHPRLPILADCFAIDLREWKRHGDLVPGHSFMREWHERRAILGVYVETTGVVLMFQRLDGLYARLPIAEERVGLVTTLCSLATRNPLAGAQTWFVCPGCGRRALKLYALKDVKFRCEACMGLRRDRLDGKMRKSRRLARINAEIGRRGWLPADRVWRKPDMPLRRFKALRAKKAALEAEGIRQPGWTTFLELVFRGELPSHPLPLRNKL